MTITEKAMILLRLPNIRSFQPRLEKYLRYDESPTACDVMFELSVHVNKIIRDGQLAELPALFEFIEELVCKGEKSVATAATTCFLENLQNFQTPTEAWVPLLGPESAAYCRAWDEFTGVRTEGLQ